MATNKRDLKAYSRFDGTGRIVPGSTVLRRNKPKNGNWKEVQAYECCDGGGGTVQLVIQNIELPVPFSVNGVGLTIRCLGESSTIQINNNVFNTPIEAINNYTDVINYLNTYFSIPGFIFLQTGPSTIEVVLDSGLLTGNCQNPNQVFLDWYPAS